MPDQAINSVLDDRAVWGRSGKRGEVSPQRGGAKQAAKRSHQQKARSQQSKARAFPGTFEPDAAKNNSDQETALANDPQPAALDKAVSQAAEQALRELNRI